MAFIDELRLNRLCTTAVALVAAAAMIPAAANGAEPVAPVVSGTSATKSRELNGFRIGMTAQEIRKLVDVTFSQGELMQADLGAVHLDFGICPSGKVFRIQSSQTLGAFTIDHQFLQGLGDKLATKYGSPTFPRPGNWEWELVEQVRFTDGNVRPVKTNWASAIVLGGNGGQVTLDMTLLDFRVCWPDAIKTNARSQRDALNRVQM